MVAIGEERVADSMREFYAHAGQTGGGSPLHPPPNDIDFIPIDFGWEDDVDENYLPVVIESVNFPGLPKFRS